MLNALRTYPRTKQITNAIKAVDRSVIDDLVAAKQKLNKPVWIAVTSFKGGVGKSLSSAALARGALLCGYEPVLVKTDLRAKNRDGSINSTEYDKDFATFDIAIDGYGAIVEFITNNESQIDCVIVDGGANREEYDQRLIDACDINLIPTFEDDETAAKTLSTWYLKPETSFVFINRWTDNKGEREGICSDLLENHHEIIEERKLIATFKGVRNAKRLLDFKDGDKSVQSGVNSECKNLFLSIFKRVKK